VLVDRVQQRLLVGLDGLDLVLRVLGDVGGVLRQARAQVPSALPEPRSAASLFLAS
jgi:hypothetical protein